MERTGPVFDFEDDSSEDDSKDQETSTDKQSKKRKAAPLLGKSLFEYASDSKDDKKPVSLDQLFEKPKEQEDKSGFFEVPKENNEADNTQEAIDPPEIITEEESRFIAENLLSDRQSNINEELEASESGSAEEAGLLNAGRLIESIKEKIAGGLPPSDEVLDEATEETVRELDLESAPEEANDQVDEEPALELAQQGVEPGAYDEEPDQDPAIPGPISPPTSGVPPTPPPTPPSAGVVGGSAAPPSSGRTAFPGFSGGYEPPAPLDAEVAGETQAASNSAVENQSNNNRRRDLLVGGIVGYLIGRRRGRIKTEERLMPVQKSLEKQVKELDSKLEERETHIRKLTEEKMAKAESKPEAKIKPSDKKESPVSVDQKPKVSPPLEHKLEKQSLKTETEPSDRREISLAKQEETKPRPVAEAKPIALSDQEILRRASRIEAQGTDLKRLFESGRLDKDKLRAIVEAHEAGYDYRRILLNSLRPERSVGIEKLTQHDSHPDQTFTRNTAAGSVYQNPFNNAGQAQQSMNQYNAPSSGFSGSSNLQQKLVSSPSAIIIMIMAVILGLIIAGMIILTF